MQSHHGLPLPKWIQSGSGLILNCCAPEINACLVVLFKEPDEVLCPSLVVLPIHVSLHNTSTLHSAIRLHPARGRPRSREQSQTASSSSLCLENVGNLVAEVFSRQIEISQVEVIRDVIVAVFVGGEVAAGHRHSANRVTEAWKGDLHDFSVRILKP